MECFPVIQTLEQKIEKLSKCPSNLFVCLENEIKDFLCSGDYYITSEIHHEIFCLEKGISSLKLAQNFFMSNHECKSSLSNKEIFNQKVLPLLKKILDFLKAAKKGLHKCTLEDALDLDIRQAHHFTLQNLKKIAKILSPFIKPALHQLDEYCANLGVTDRFSGYRHNLNQGFNHPKLDAATKQVAEEPLPTRTKRNYCLEKRLERLICKEQDLKSIQKQFGILADFPDVTEYRDCYRVIERKPLLPYIINPTPNYNIDGRTMAKRLKNDYNTSYSINFQWPTNDKLPYTFWTVDDKK